MKILVIFQKQEGEKTNAYSLVTPELLLKIPESIILKEVEVEDRLYSKDELENLVKTNL